MNKFLSAAWLVVAWLIVGTIVGFMVCFSVFVFVDTGLWVPLLAAGSAVTVVLACNRVFDHVVSMELRRKERRKERNS